MKKLDKSEKECLLSQLIRYTDLHRAITDCDVCLLIQEFLNDYDLIWEAEKTWKNPYKHLLKKVAEKRDIQMTGIYSERFDSLS